MLERFLAIQAMGSDNARQNTKTTKQAVLQYPPPSPVALAAGLDMLQNIDLRNQLKKLSVPCQMFLGHLDSLVPEKIGPLVQQLNPMITIDVITDASHDPFISNTESFAKRLVKTLI